MQNIIQIYPCLLKLSRKQESVTDGQTDRRTDERTDGRTDGRTVTTTISLTAIAGDKKVQKDKQRSTKHTYKTKDRVTRTPLKTGVTSGAPEG
jgi:hypothetical protein